MAEQTFRSPGFFEQEIDLSSRAVAPSGTPAGVIGTADRGPAFVPVTVGSFADFETKFGTLDTNRFGPYAVREFLNHRTALTYMRLLGAGANETSTDMTNTRDKGTVKNAGFVISGTNSSPVGKAMGAVQLVVAQHSVPIEEAAGYPVFTDNNSFTFARDAAANTANLVRGVIFTTTGSKIQLLAPGSAYSVANVANDQTTAAAIAGSPLTIAKYFKLVISSSLGGSGFGNDDGFPGIRILSASLDPNDGAYIGKVLNTDPLKFQEENHLLYLDFAVEEDLASTVSQVIGLASGSENTSVASGDATLAFATAFGRFDTRYTTPRTTNFISQPFGVKEYDLFHFETLSDGVYANAKFKISIANLRASTDPKDKFGTFEVQVREFGDTDTNTEVLERYPECNLDPNSDRYIARQIGDKKVRYDFDAEQPDERRLVIAGKYPNVSQRIRVRMNAAVEESDVPQDVLPFGFRGIPTLKTSDTLTDATATALTMSNGRIVGDATPRRMTLVPSSEEGEALSGSIVPPMPFRFKVTRGDISNSTSPAYVGQTGKNERVDGRFYWGVKFERMPLTGTLSNAILNTNVSNVANPLIAAYTQFAGIQKLDTLVTGSGKDGFNDNKFTLARVAFSNTATSGLLSSVFTVMSSSAREHIKEAAYIRNGQPDRNTYTVSDGTTGGSNRFTLASLVQTSSVLFNRFTEYSKFTNPFYGGFDGVNILDNDQFFFKDRAFSSDTGGKAGGITSMPGGNGIGLCQVSSKNQAGEGRVNNNVASARRAVDIMTDPMSVNINILSIPGVRDTFVSDHALDRTKAYSQAIYLMDLIKYDEDSSRLYGDSTARPDVRETSEAFESRAVDNNYGATFFPDVSINDAVNNQVVMVPASVAALGTLGFNDKIAFPWFAPAGFNRAGLDFVVNVETRLTSDDRDKLYDARINPIAVFPRAGFVIFGQKTLQATKSALDRINVRRLMLEVKRQVVRVADKLLFEPNTSQTRARFISQVTPLLALIQAQNGVEQFKVVMDDTNNTTEDVEANKLNGRIVVVPTRAIEFIAVDFIITNSGVSFD